MQFTATIQTSFFDRPSESAIVSATNWMVGLMTGTLATAIAIIAIAWIGFAMLAGRVDVKRGLTVVLGCFLLFGARSIVDGLRGMAANGDSQAISATRPPNQMPRALPSPNTANAFDPYAGADAMPPDE